MFSASNLGPARPPAQLVPNRPIAAPAPFPPRNCWPRGGELVAPTRRAGGPEAAQVWHESAQNSSKDVKRYEKMGK